MRFPKAYDPLRSLEASWKQLKRTPLTAVLGGVLPLILQVVFAHGMQFVLALVLFHAGPPGKDQMQRLLPGLGLLVFAVGLGTLLITSWIDVGFARATERALRTGEEQTRMLFQGLDRLGTLLLARILCALAFLPLYLPVFLLMLVQVVVVTLPIHPALKIAGFVVIGTGWLAGCAYVMLGFSLVTPIVALGDCSAVEAIRRSWRHVNGNRWQLIWFWIFTMLLALAGELACCVGLLVAIPLIELMRVESYVALAGGQAGTRRGVDGQDPQDYSSRQAPGET